MVETMIAGRKLAEDGDTHQIGQLMIKTFGNNISPNLQAKIIKQYDSITNEQVEVFYHHTLFVQSIKHISDFIPLKNIKAKTLLLNGENDNIVDTEENRSIVDIIPDCELQFVKNTGHFLHFENSDILKIYYDFFKY